ncbi:MAG: hypothetical protein JW940_03935, partial [Polyangiaceae bacterium]|nr:hypothetical protein [Polyangiaceae bacterium]
MARYLIRGSRLSLLVAIAGLGCASCSGHAASALDTHAGTDSDAAADSDAEQDEAPVPDALVFDGFERGDTLRLKPADEIRLVVHASPAARYQVKFALVADAKDASLDRSVARTDSDGIASVELIAPSSASLFTVRASVGTQLKAELPVSVSKDGFATLRLKPVYAGLRRIAGWVASIHPDADCSSLQGAPYADGSAKTEVGSNDTAVIKNVPIGQQFAATLRSAQLAGGCIETGNLSAGTVTELDVPILDRPMQLEGLKLGLVLGIDTSFR